MNTQDWSPLEWTSWISLQAKGLSRVFSNTTVKKHQFFGTSCEELTHWKRPWCWEGSGAGEGDDRGWDGWMASPTWWTWVWVNSGSWWWDREAWRAEIHGVAKSRTRLSDWTELNCPAIISGGFWLRGTTQRVKGWPTWSFGRIMGFLWFSGTSMFTCIFSHSILCLSPTEIS